MACPADLPREIVAHGPPPVAEEPSDAHRTVVEALPAHRFHGVTPHLSHGPNDHQDVPLILGRSRRLPRMVLAFPIYAFGVCSCSFLVHPL
jgi:hypothetical protein